MKRRDFALATTGAADGFNVLAPTLPHGLTEFSDHVIPELQRRGLFRTEYTGTTLREHLGLARPAHPAYQRASLLHQREEEKLHA